MRSGRFALRGLTVFVVPCAALVVTACPVDDRTLVLEETSSNAGAGSKGNGGSAGKSSMSRGGAGGEMGGEGGDFGSGGEGGDFGSGGAAGSGGVAGNGGAAGSGGVAGNGGAASNGGAAGAGGSGGSNGGAAGAGGSNGGGGGSGGTAGCAEDLNGNSIADCEETLLVNAAFDLDASSWASEPDSDKVWDTTNATSTSGSGSIAVTNTNFDANIQGQTGRAATQCVPVTAGTLYLLQGHAFIPTGQTGVTAQLAAFYYASSNCSGSMLSTPFNNAPFTTDAGTWVHLQSSMTPPEGAQSVLLRLHVIKPFNQTTATAKFDNLLFLVP